MSTGETPKIPTYWVGVHFVLCLGPIDKITKIFVSDKQVYPYNVNGFSQPEITDGSNTLITADKIFGGTQREGGIYGFVNFLFGKSDQQLNNYLLSLFGAPIPTYRGVVSAILNRVYVGTNYYLKPWSFVATRIHTRQQGIAQWQDTFAEVPHNSGLMNAVHIIRECLTDPIWGLGHSESVIDEESFLAAAETCYDEGLGFGFFWNNDAQIIDFIEEVRKHINAYVYVSRFDGKFHISLQRPIEDTTSLFELNSSNTRSVEDFTRKSLGDLISSVTVKYTDKDTNQTATVIVNDSSLAQRQGVINSKSLTYSGIATPEVAQKIAIRDLRQYGAPIYSCTIKCNREIENLNVGDAFLLSWPDYCEEKLTMRIVSMDLGGISKGEITVTAVEDYFAANDHMYFNPILTIWTDPVTEPGEVSICTVGEVPYYMAERFVGGANAQAIPSTSSYTFIGAKAPSSDTYSALINSSLDSNFGEGNYQQQGILLFCYAPILLNSIDREATTISVSYHVTLETVVVGHFLQIEDEYVGITSISGGDIEIIRGVLDTVPAFHEAGAQVYAIQDANGFDGVEWLLGETIYYRFLTYTPRGLLELSAAPTESITLSGRLHKPYPPANVKFNTLYWPESLPTGEITLNWATRNRLTEVADLISWYSGNIASEAGVTYSGELRSTADNSLLSSFSGVTGTSASFSTSYVGEVKAEIWSVRGTFTSFQRVEHTFELTS